MTRGQTCGAKPAVNGIIRVFPRRTVCTPDDALAFVGLPPLDYMIPEHREVHVLCAFTWDKAGCGELAYQWGAGRAGP